MRSSRLRRPSVSVVALAAASLALHCVRARHGTGPDATAPEPQDRAHAVVRGDETVGPGGWGSPIDAPVGRWTWVEVPEARCRDGSPAGMAVRPSPTRGAGLVLYLQEGGACYNAATCARNRPSFGPAEFGTGPSEGIFSTSDGQNPVRAYDFVFVPYCTGDVHGGDATDVTVPGVPGVQQFVGYRNLGHFLRRIVPTFRHDPKVLLTGSSAGAFGALLQGPRVRRAFGDTPVYVVSDSGQPTRAASPCLQRLWRTLWRFDATLLGDCGSSCRNRDDYMTDFVLRFAEAGVGRPTGIVSSTDDRVNRAFFGFGLDDCRGGSMSAEQFRIQLVAFRAEAQRAGARVSTFYVPANDHHVWFESTVHFHTTVDGVSLSAWLSDLLSDAPPRHVGLRAR